MPSLKEKIRLSIEKGNKLKDAHKHNFVSTHHLKFEASPFYKDIFGYRVGTCSGKYSYDGENYIIISVINDDKGNGHLQDVFDWFENSCKRDKKDLMVVEFFNKEFMQHLITKKGFKAIDDNDVIKYFKKK